MLPTPGFCKHAIWIFGVLVGLAIKEAITRVVPHGLAYAAEPPGVIGPEALRLVVFGVMIVRFYLGAAYLFDVVHAEALTKADAIKGLGDTATSAQVAQARHAAWQFGIDFFAALLHFTIFSVWSLTLELHHFDAHSTEPVAPEWSFRLVLLFLLTYDLSWLLARPRPHPRALKTWAFVNLMTAIIATLWYQFLVDRWHWTSAEAESWPLLFILAVSLVDLAELTTGKTFFSTAVVVVARGLAQLLLGLASRLSRAGASLKKVGEDLRPRDPPSA